MARNVPIQSRDCCHQHYCCSPIVLPNYFDDCYCFCDDWMKCRCPANDRSQYHDRMWWHRCEFGNFGVDLSDNCLPHLSCRSAMETDFAYRVRVLKFLTAHISHWSSQRLCWFWLVFRTDDLHSFQTECEYWCSEIEMYICKSVQQHSIHWDNHFRFFWFNLVFESIADRLLIDCWSIQIRHSIQLV